MTTQTPTVAAPAEIKIFDTTLRDGEQSPGASMTLEEKVQVAEVLDAMGVDIIEAGFPIASTGDFEAVQTIARRTQNSVVAGLARSFLDNFSIKSSFVVNCHEHLFLRTFSFEKVVFHR